MVEAIRRVAPIVATGVVVIVSLGIGYRTGEASAQGKATQIVVPAQAERFEKISDTTALDRKTGQVCDTYREVSDGRFLPKGATLDTGHPLCSELR